MRYSVWANGMDTGSTGTSREDPPCIAATCSSWFLARGFFYPEDGLDTSVDARSTRRHIPEDGILSFVLLLIKLL
jgi:hypothetical protein